jgi:hypothetical protein
VRALGLALVLVVGAAPPRGLATQDVAARLEGRVAADVARAVQGIAQDALARGLPVEPLIQKAIEGGAKGVPAERVIGAVRMLAARLDEARAALREAGITQPSADALEGGADALNAGLNTRQVREIGRVSRPPYDAGLTLRVAATLTVLGVPPKQGLQVMEHIIQARRGPDVLLDLPNEVQVGMARGATAAEAAEELDAAQRGHGPGEHGDHGDHGEHEHGRAPTPHKP